MFSNDHNSQSRNRSLFKKKTGITDYAKSNLEKEWQNLNLREGDIEHFLCFRKKGRTKEYDISDTEVYVTSRGVQWLDTPVGRQHIGTMYGAKEVLFINQRKVRLRLYEVEGARNL